MRKRKIGQVLALFMLILGLGMTADETEQLWQSESTGTTGETTEEGGYIADTIEVPTLTEAEAPQAQAAGEGMQKQSRSCWGLPSPAPL